MVTAAPAICAGVASIFCSFLACGPRAELAAPTPMRSVSSAQTDPYFVDVGVGQRRPLGWTVVATGRSQNERVLKRLDEIGARKGESARLHHKKVKDGGVKLYADSDTRIYKNYDPPAKIIKWTADGRSFEVQRPANPKLADRTL